MPKHAKEKQPRHKPRNASRTKARIIEAAQQLFAAHGYAQAGIREIATLAGVAVSLVPQHFGSKARLFEAALIAAIETSTALDGPRNHLGRSLVDQVLNSSDMRLPRIVVLSIGNTEAREIVGRVTRERILAGLAHYLGPPDAANRAIEIVMQLTGFLIYGRELPLGQVSARTRNNLARLLQAIVDES
jgi:AcrR family transcriptional regulator